MKIYTKKGDQGKTGLIGGSRISKNSLRIECYGTIDELNSYLGVVRDTLKTRKHDNQLISIQETLFSIGSHLACMPGGKQIQLPELNNELINNLEKWIDDMNENLDPIKYFTLPGGALSASNCHVARCICRRAERICVELNNESSLDKFILPFLNRLSDYLFILSRKLMMDEGVEERKWQPKQ